MAGPQILICHNEAAARAAADLLQMDTADASDLDWARLAGHRVILWPANTKLSLIATQLSARTAHDAGAETVRVIDPGPLTADGFDATVANAEGWDRETMLAWLRERAADWVPAVAPAPEEPPHHTEAQEYRLPDLAQDATPINVDFPFRVLGYNDGVYYYFAPGSQQVAALPASAHSVSNLLTLAPLNYWEEAFAGASARAPFHITGATNAMIQASHAKGIFQPNRRRGRGAWIDAGRPVMHLGGTVYLSDEEFQPRDVPSQFIYEAAAPLEISRTAPARTEDAQRLVDICRRLTWENPLSAQLLAGWCVIAPVCGALTWRPHIWITGSSGSGKSTVVKDVIGRLVGPFAERVEGGTTEAGIRQALSLDARPVIMDEAEPEGKTAASRMDAIVQLARTSSSGATIVKGSADGLSKQFAVRSCFAFSSINTAIAQYADETRISKLVLRPNLEIDKEQHFQDLMRDIHEWFDETYAARMFARTVLYLPVLLKNIATFTDAAATAIHNRRAADQIAAMCAGLLLCHSTKEISYDDALAWIRRHVWSDHAVVDGSDDEARLLTVIATASCRVNGLHGIKEITVGEMLNNPSNIEGVAEAEVRKALGRLGIRHDGDTFTVANHSPALAKVLDGTAWARSWARSLASLDGAEKTPTAVYFYAAFRQRGVTIPLRHLVREPGE